MEATSASTGDTALPMESELIAETTRGRLAGSQRCRSLDSLLAPGINAGRFASQAILLSVSFLLLAVAFFYWPKKIIFEYPRLMVKFEKRSPRLSIFRISASRISSRKRAAFSNHSSFQAGETSPNAKVMVSGITLFRTAKPARCLKSNRAPVSIPTAPSTNGEAGRRANYRALMETKFTDGSPGP